MMIKKEPRRNRLFQLSVFLIFALLVACREEPVNRSVELVYQSQQCRIQKPGLTVIETADTLESTLSAIRGLGVDASPVSIDFSSYFVLVVSAGQQPTAGTQLRLLSKEAVLIDGVLSVDVSIEEPTGAVAQVITSPCILLSLLREGVETVALVDGSYSNSL